VVKLKNMNEFLLKIRQTPGHASVRDTARVLGLDTYTLYTLIQRERIAYDFGAGGEIIVSEQDVKRLATKEQPC
jgi:hypothetical protein